MVWEYNEYLHFKIQFDFAPSEHLIPSHDLCSISRKNDEKIVYETQKLSIEFGKLKRVDANLWKFSEINLLKRVVKGLAIKIQIVRFFR